MSEDKVETTDEIACGCPSPARLEKADSGSSRQSGSPVHWDSESWDRAERIRPSSWDDSDDDSSPNPETSESKASRIYSSESKTFKGSISFEINELKKQFFQSLGKEYSGNDDGLRLENLKEKFEMKFKCDRRQSPARVRRRSKSSSSSSPVPETQNSPETMEKGTGPDLELDDSDGTSPRIQEMDSRYYLNNFFAGLRSKRISMLDSIPMTDNAGKDGVLICDNMKLEMLNQLNAPDLNDDDGYFCKTSRKLSQILEVEENRKDLEKSSEDSLEKPGLFCRDPGEPHSGDSSPPLQTARGKRSDITAQTAGDGRQRRREGYRSLSFEEFGGFQKVGKPSRGSLSERSGRIFESKIDDDFIHLCAKTGKTQLSSLKLATDQDVEKSYQFLCFAGALGEKQNFSAEQTPREEDAGKNSQTRDCLSTVGMPGSPTSRKSTDRSEQSHGSRTRSGQSRRSGDRGSPRFALSIGGDSARNLGVDEVNTPHSQSKGEENRAISRSKRSSTEDCSGRNSNKSSFRSEGTCESKTDKNLHIRLDSPSLESLKSSRSFSGHQTTRNNSRSRPSTQRSQRTGKGSNADANVEHTPRRQNLSLETCGNSPAGSSKSFERAKNTSCRPEPTKKTPRSPTTSKDGFSSRASDPRTPRSPKIPDLGLLLEIVGRPESEKAFCRNPNVAELDDGMKDTDQSQSNTDRPSDRSLGSRSRSGRLRKSTPRSRSATPQTSGSNSARSKDEERPRIIFSEEFESVCDPLSNRTLTSAATRKSSCRETDAPSQQPSCRSENSAAGKTSAPVPDNSSEERPFGSRKSPRRSVDSWDKTSPRSLRNISPSKSKQAKSRPVSGTSAESKCSDVLSDVEKLDTDVRSGRSTNRSFVSEKYEEKEECHSSPGSKSGTESDRQSNKRLSIINEVTFEDFENGSISLENGEKDRPPARRTRKRVSPKSIGTTPRDAPVASVESFKGKSSDESTPRIHPSDGGTWTELIQTFEGSQNSSLLSEKIFPGFPSRIEGNSVRLSVYPSATETLEKLYEGSDDVNLEDSFELSRKDGTLKSERKHILEKGSDQQREEDFSFGLVFKDSLRGKMKAEENGPPPSPQSLFYVDVDKSGPFGIGEFGDMTWWSGGKSDLEDLDKPKDHGDGMHSFKSSEILLKPEKREKEMKNQRQLWTELREDFRDSRLFSNDRFPGVQSDSDDNGFIPIGLRTSKSDNCINRKLREGSECHSSAIYEFLSENKEREKVQNELLENIGERDVNPGCENMADPFGSGSVDSGKEGLETGEFDCDRTPRLSRSMSDLASQLPLERCKSDELSGEGYNSSRRGELFEKPISGESEEKEVVNLDIFLARKREEEIEVKSNNWLHLKSVERKKSGKREKKSKIKMKKGFSLSREPYVEYLTSRKSPPSMSGLKQRNANCFQSFYKRFISVFCVTSNSSAATSK